MAFTVGCGLDFYWKMHLVYIPSHLSRIPQRCIVVEIVCFGTPAMIETASLERADRPASQIGSCEWAAAVSLSASSADAI